jgi:hypothetical protein
MARIWDRLLDKSLTWADRIRPDHSQDSFEIVDGSGMDVGEFRAGGCMRGIGAAVHVFEPTMPTEDWVIRSSALAPERPLLSLNAKRRGRRDV